MSGRLDRFDKLERAMEKSAEVDALLDRVVNCQEHNVDLNDWEDNFLEDVTEKKLLKGYPLTGPQLDTLEKIEMVVAEGRQSIWD